MIILYIYERRKIHIKLILIMTNRVRSGNSLFKDPQQNIFILHSPNINQFLPIPNNVRIWIAILTLNIKLLYITYNYYIEVNMSKSLNQF